MTESSGGTYSLVELWDFDRDDVGLLVALKLVQAYFLLDDLPKEERKQLLVVASLSEILAESLCRMSQ